MKYLNMMLISTLIIFSCAGKRPQNLGVHDGKLTDCPSSPNCVSSQTADEKHFLASFVYQGNKEAAFDRLKNIIASREKFKVVSETGDYLYIECRSKFMGFVDDLEFFFPKEKIIHVRSASRLGYSDFGVNRKRVEDIRKQFNSYAH